MKIKYFIIQVFLFTSFFSFTNAQNSITVLMPNGGESYYSGFPQTVTWTSYGTVGNVNIALSSNGANGPWTTVDSNTPNDGTQQCYLLPSITASTQCRVRIQDVSGSPTDISDNNFTMSIWVPPALPELSVDPLTLNFGYMMQNLSKNMSFTITNIGGLTLTGDITSNRSWITLSTGNFIGSSTPVNVTVNTTGLTEEVNIGTVTILSNGGVAEVGVNVKLVTQHILVNTSLLDFGEIKLGENKILPFTIINSSTGVLNGTITKDKEWIILDKNSFSGNTIINVTVDNGILGQKEGEHTGTILIDSNGGQATVQVNLTATCVLLKPNPYNPNKGNLTFFGDGIVPEQTTIKVYTLNGEKIAELSADKKNNEITWDGKAEQGKPISNGIYIYTYESPKEKGVGKFTAIQK